VEVLQPSLKLRLGGPGGQQLLVAPKQREGGRAFNRA
jgi:hypothetical protein